MPEPVGSQPESSSPKDSSPSTAVCHAAHVEEQTAEDFEALLRVNLLGPFLGIQAVLCADASAYVTGAEFAVDGGMTAR
ncbi:hypothetical protein [Streptomyces goshikiensis]|uniref:hypothetical protein n=1 Tax=Streptomyces goshikiensis TaxID=1942 RepID=UPI0036C2FE29